MSVRLLALGLLLLLAALQDKPAELQEFSSKEGGFTIKLPDRPKERETKTRSPDGKEVTNHLFLIDQKTTAYVVGYMIVPSLAKATPELKAKALENGRKSAETSLNGKLLKEEKITLEGHPGLEFRLEVSEQIYRSRVYIVNDRLYQVTVLAPKDVALSKESDAIFDSFKLMK